MIRKYEPGGWRDWRPRLSDFRITSLHQYTWIYSAKEIGSPRFVVKSTNAILFRSTHDGIQRCRESAEHGIVLKENGDFLTPQATLLDNSSSCQNALNHIQPWQYYCSCNSPRNSSTSSSSSALILKVKRRVCCCCLATDLCERIQRKFLPFQRDFSCRKV